MAEELTKTTGGALTTTESAALEYIGASVSDNTRRAYNSNWKRFESWCNEQGRAALPASAETVGLYVTTLAEGGKQAATIDQARAAIRFAHEVAGVEDNTDAVSVRQVLRGIRRTIGTAQTGKRPTLATDIKAMVAELPRNGLKSIRDKALLLVGFAGGFRRSELAGLEVSDMVENSEGLKITLRRSKTDQEGKGRVVGICRSDNPVTCPVRAVQAWLSASGITEGYIFRHIDRHGRILAGITPQAVALVVKIAALDAGLDPSVYSGHSLRAGLVTQAALNGASDRNIMRQTGHKSQATVQRYVRIANLFKDNVSGSIGL